MYVYVRSDTSLYTVGFYAPDGKWHAESDHGSASEAAARVHWLNGGQKDDDRETIEEGDARYYYPR